MKQLWYWILSCLWNNLQEETWRKRLMTRWNYLVWKEEMILNRDIKPLYISTKSFPPHGHQVVFMSDEKWVSGGICDKFRGIVSLYLICEKYECNFKINWTYPFQLLDYLIPNKIDWRYNEEFVRNKDSKPIQMMSYHDYFDIEEKANQRKRLEYILKDNKRFRELHVYTNAHFGNDNFHRIFTRLFKPSEHINLLLNKYQPKCQYISLSFRFLQLLGDFKDRSGGSLLSEEEKEIYLEDTLMLINRMHKQNASKMIFVATDSSILIDKVKKFDFVFTIPGSPKHSDLPASNFDKEFLDFFMISGATEVFLCIKGQMYTSGFPYYASLAGDKPFKILRY